MADRAAAAATAAGLGLEAAFELSAAAVPGDRAGELPPAAAAAATAARSAAAFSAAARATAPESNEGPGFVGVVGVLCDNCFFVGGELAAAGAGGDSGELGARACPEFRMKCSGAGTPNCFSFDSSNVEMGSFVMNG